MGSSVSRGLLLCVLRGPVCIGISAIEVGYKFWGVFQVLHGFPGTVTRGESLPLDQVMEFTPSSLSPYLLDFFDLIFFFSIDKVRHWSGIVRPVQRHFLIRCQEVGVDHRVYLPLGR